MTEESVTQASEARRVFAVCVRNEGYDASLELHKIYIVVPDADAGQENDIRIIDESGEDYLYPASWFVRIDVPDKVEASLIRAS